MKLLLCCISAVHAGSMLNLGTPESILNTVVKENTRSFSRYIFISSSGERIPVRTEFFYFEHGELSMSGKAVESDSSLFLLKGNKNDMYGWVALMDKGVAYEYTTNEAGNVISEKVPVSRVISVDDFGMAENAGGSKPVAFCADSDYYFKTYPKSIPWVGKYDGTSSVLHLQSMPGASKVIWMDLSRAMNGETPKNLTKEDVFMAWEIVAASYSMFKVNVTTDADVQKAAGNQNSGIARINAGPGMSSSPVGAFGTGRYASVYEYCTTHWKGGFSFGRVAAHELGHVTGVYDYGGTPGGTYFMGFHEFKWTILMGNMWPADTDGTHCLIQWSKGEYATATVKTDAIQVFSKYMPMKEDDMTSPVPLKFDGNTNRIEAKDNFGMICPNTDSDEFTFEIRADKGHADFKVDRLEHRGGSKLDIDASILDESGKVLAQDTPKAARYSKFDLDLPRGKYKVLVKGGHEGTPQKGFSTYSSMGLYGFEGEITGANNTGITMRDYADHFFRCTVSPDGMVHLDLPRDCLIKKVALFSLNGTMVFESSGTLNGIDVSRMASGMYILCVSGNDMKITRKIVK